MTRTLVANTRPADQAAELSQLLREAGFEPLDVPAIEVLPEGPALTPDNSYAWLILPSPNAARFSGVTALNSPRVLCGAATAHALGLSSAAMLDPFSARAALEWLRPRVQAGERVLIPRAADGRDELIVGLRALGVIVDAPIVYRTRPAESGSLSRLRSDNLAAITFCSPSAVNAVAAAIPLGAVPIVCLGQTTADALAVHGISAAAVAERTSMRSLVAAVRKALPAMQVGA